MFACIYFCEDASLSVVGRNDPDLKILGNFSPREKVEMKWKIKGNTSKVLYHGIVIKVGDKEDTLVEFANKAYTRIIKKEKEELIGKEPPESLYGFEANKKSVGKRKRVETERVKESKIQEETLSPKKRKKKDKAPSEGTEKKIIKRPLISTETEISRLILSSQFEDLSNSASSDGEQIQLPVPTSPSLDRQTTPAKETLMPTSHANEVNEGTQTPSEAPVSSPPPSFLHAETRLPYEARRVPVSSQTFPPSENRTYHTLMPVNQVPERLVTVPSSQPLPDETSFSTTWSLCTSAMTDNVPQADNDVQTPQHLNFITIPAPSPEVFDVLRGLLRQDVQDYLAQIVGKFTDRPLESTTFQENNKEANYFDPIPRPNAQHPVTRDLSNSSNRPVEASQVNSSSADARLINSHTAEARPADARLINPHPADLRPADARPVNFYPVDARPVEVRPANPRPAEETKQMAKLLDDADIMVSKDGLRKAVSDAKKSSKPGYKLCYKLLTELFSLETLAASRGQGLGNAREMDKPVLDKEKVQVLKNYVVIWCRKNDCATPSEQLLNSAITERITYARKQCVKRGILPN